ncbi:P-loop NTPase fold protein [Spirosoma endophyticum]|uniref:KAP family P-loop domain-containing protein n=1 Tax=Spirosoma endophyticum TaxID=662367 RepID=A0A1I2BA31_9BACT|nr:P-loop NTPase fold protein [Spirosoma endophyticum]SFE52010.1 KAP family P-loop domain-containing protein [Spirosoma endophyticum]
MKEIEITRPFEAFAQHISPEENQRILFSAPFGSGKTYFLREYFKTVSETTNTFWLSPVKYVVSQNEDIFEYIKYDLAHQLLQYNAIIQELKAKIGEAQYAYQYVVNNPKDIFKLLFSALENAPTELLVGDPITKGINKIGKMGNVLVDGLTKYQDYKKKLDSHLATTNDVLDNYLKETRDIKGSIFEDDLISQMIRLGLDKIKKPGHENVLIVDDLDRLDPEHIFRILNILSVHQDSPSGGNKFGFSKIIVVCDLKNIRNIYIHKYGGEVDFEGYIEKFYSTNIFDFSNEQAVAMYCRSDLTADLSDDGRIILGEYLHHFVKIGKRTVRSIVKHHLKPNVQKFILVSGPLINYGNDSKFESQINTDGFHSDAFYIETSDFELIKIIKILLVIFGDYESLYSAVKEAVRGPNDIPLDCLLPALKVIAPMQLLMVNFDTPKNLAVSFHQNEEWPHKGANVVRNPYIDIFGVRVGLQLKWDRANPYIGQESFYSNEAGLISEERVKQQISRIPDPNYKFTMRDLLSALDGAIAFLKIRNFVDRLA